MSTFATMLLDQDGNKQKALQYVFVPELLRSWFATILSFALFVAIGMFYSQDLKGTDDAIYQTYGISSSLMYISQGLFIFFGPALYSYAFLIAVPWIVGHGVRIHLLFDHLLIASSTMWGHRVLIVLKIFCLMLFSTVFAVNDEWPEMQMFSWCTFVIALVVTEILYAWYLPKFSLLSDSLITAHFRYTVLFAIAGILYVGQALAITFGGESMRNDSFFQFLDSAVTALVVGQFVFAWLFYNNLGTLKLTMTIDNIQELSSGSAEETSLLDSQDQDEEPVMLSGEPTSSWLANIMGVDTRAANKDATDLKIQYEFKYAPDYWLSLWFLTMTCSLAFCGVVTYYFSDIDWEDNLVIRTFGYNSSCIVFDLPPSIYFGPTLAMIMDLTLIPYGFGQLARVWIMNLNGLTSDFVLNVYKVTVLLEMLSIGFFPTIFAVQDENMILHSWAYMQFIICICLMSLRNCWFFVTFSKRSTAIKGFFMLYTAILASSGLAAVAVNAEVLQYGPSAIRPINSSIAIVWTFSALALSLVGAVIGTSNGVLHVSAELDDVYVDKKDSRRI